MSNYNKMFEDFSKIAGSAMNTAFHSMADFKKQCDAMVKQQTELVLGRMDLVSREEFDVVKDMLSKSRIEQDKLTKKISELEKAIHAQTATKAAPAAKATKPAAVKPAAKPAPKKPVAATKAKAAPKKTTPANKNSASKPAPKKKK